MSSKKYGSKSRKQTPSYLYLKDGIYYYRRRLPKCLRDKGRRQEIRICLHTAYKNVAVNLAPYIHIAIKNAVEKWQMNGEINPDYQNDQTATLDASIHDEVKRILATGPNHPITGKEIETRLNGYISKILEANLNSFAYPHAVMDRHGDENRSPAEIWDINAQGILDDLNNCRNVEYYKEEAILTAMENDIIDETEISDANVESFVKLFMIMQYKLYRILAARFRGDFALENNILPPNISSCTTSKKIPDAQSHDLSSCADNQNDPEKLPSLKISEVIEKYVSTKLEDGAWQQRTIPDHRNRISLLLNIIGDKNINDICRSDMRRLRDILKSLPPRWKEKYTSYNGDINKIIEMAKDEDKLSTKTINTTMEAISSMFSWAINEGFIDKNPAAGLGIKDQQADIDKRQPLSIDEIQSIFFDGQYKESNYSNPAFYWCPLIGLYTGMRLEEICQLHCEDIVEIDSIMTINVTKNSNDGLNDKILKTKNAERMIPIHPKLIELGLLEYRDKISASGSLRLFPLLNKTEKSPKYGKQVSKRFTQLLKKKNISDSKSFHSLRHSFSNFFKKKNMHTDMFRQVFGHDIGHLAGRRYGDRFTPKEIYDELISKLNYDQ